MIAPTGCRRSSSAASAAVNSSVMSVSVAPAALPMPSARWPALRPIAMTKYQREVVLASTIRFLTISTPKWRAVWKPKVSTCAGRSRSLSIVFGTWTTRMRPAARSSSFIAENAVSSPPMVISCETPRRSSESMVRSSSFGSLVGLARAMPRYEPPRKWMRLTSSMPSGMTWSMSPCMIHSKPSRMPTTSIPSSRARIVAAPMTR